jgi:hypothetical protein
MKEDCALGEFLISAFTLKKGPDHCFAVCRTYDKDSDQHVNAIPTRASLNEIMRAERESKPSESDYRPVGLHMVHLEYGEEHRLRWHVLLTTDEVHSMIKSTQMSRGSDLEKWLEQRIHHQDPEYEGQILESWKKEQGLDEDKYIS